MKKRSRDIFKFLFFLSIGALLVWLAIRGKTPQEMQNIRLAVSQADYKWVFLSLLVSALSHYFRALRWKLLLQPLGHRPRTSNTFFAVMVGYLANCALPRVGEVTRCGILNRYEKIPFTEGFGTVIAERALDMLCLVVIFFITLGLQFGKISGLAHSLVIDPAGSLFEKILRQQIVLLVSGILFLLFTLSLWYFRKKLGALLSQKVVNFFTGLRDGLLSIRKVNQPLMFTLHTVLIWLMYCLQVYVCFLAFGETSSLGFMASVAITVFGSLGVVLVPGGTGLYQAIVIQILTTAYLISDSTSFAFAWAVWVAQIVLILVAGFASLILLPLLNRNGIEDNAEIIDSKSVEVETDKNHV